MFMRTLRERLFDLDAETGAGGGGDAKPPAAPPVPPSVDPTAGGDAAGKDGGKIEMTSAQLADRLSRARNTERADLAKSLGFDTVEALQTAVKAGEEARKAQMSEQERQAAVLKEAQERATTLQAQLAQADAARTETVIRAQAIEIMAGKFTKPGTAFKLLDLSGVKLESDGTVSGLTEAVDKLAKDEPWTLSATPGTSKQEVTPRTIADPQGDGTPKENEDEKRRRYFGVGIGGDFFKGGGVKPAVVKRPTQGG